MMVESMIGSCYHNRNNFDFGCILFGSDDSGIELVVAVGTFVVVNCHSDGYFFHDHLLAKYLTKRKRIVVVE